MQCEITAFSPCQLGLKKRNMGGRGRMLLTGGELSFVLLLSPSSLAGTLQYCKEKFPAVCKNFCKQLTS